MIRVAILGAGIGAEHLAAYRALPDLFDVAWICDLDTARAERTAGDIPVAADSAVVLRDQTVDLIDICLPPHLHVPMALGALSAGKHVICEKPLACALADVDRLETAAAAAARQVFPVFQYRFGPAMAQLRALADAGLLGRPYAATFETHWSRDASYYAVGWRGTWAGELGGAVLGHAIHAHDLLTVLLGPVARLSARMATRVHPIETEDTAALSFEMENGALATSSVTLGAARDISRIKLIYEGVTAESGAAPYAPMAGGWTFVARRSQDQPRVDAVRADTAPGATGFEGYLVEIARCLTGQAHHAVTLLDGRRSVELVTAAYSSARTGLDIVMPVAKDHALYGGWAPERRA